MKMEQTECSETSVYKIKTPGNYPKESIKHSGHGESLKSRISLVVLNSEIPPLHYTAIVGTPNACSTVFHCHLVDYIFSINLITILVIMTLWKI